MKTANRELLDRLAAEYVLGTLRGGARKRFERWLLSPQVGALVSAWEHRLAGLEAPLERVAPPPAVWRKVEQRLDLRAVTRAPFIRRFAIAASVLLVVTLGYVGYQVRNPELVPTQTAQIAESAATIYWQVELLGDSQEIRLRVAQTHAIEAGKSHELWALPAQEGAPPVSLGLLPQSGEIKRVLTAAQRAALAGAAQLAVSVEPEGGSRTGLPTGPVIHVAPLRKA